MNILFRNNKLYLKDINGNLEQLSQYSYAYDCSEGVFCIGIGTDPLTCFGGKCGYISENGEMIIEPSFDYARPFCDGLAVISVGCDKNGFGGKYGFIDKTGKVVIEPIYSHARDFIDGVSAVAIGGNKYGKGSKWGLIDKKGDSLITTEYTFIGAFLDGCAWIQMGSFFGFINTKGEQITPLVFSNTGDFHEGLAFVKGKEKGSLYGYIDTDGNYAIEPQFENANNFIDGVAIVRLNKKYGIIDKSGRFVLEPEYDRIDEWNSFMVFDTKNGVNVNLKPNWTVVVKKKKCGIIDKQIDIIIEPQFDIIDNEIRDGMIKVHMHFKDDHFDWYKTGFISEDGKTIIAPIYDNASAFENGRAKVCLGRGKDAKHGYIDKKGNWIE